MQQEPTNASSTSAPESVVILVPEQRAGADANAVAAGESLLALVETRGIRHSRIAVQDDGRLAGDTTGALAACSLLVDLLPTSGPTKDAALLAAGPLLPPSAIILSLADYRPIRSRADASARPDRFLGIG